MVKKIKNDVFAAGSEGEEALLTSIEEEIKKTETELKKGIPSDKDIDEQSKEKLKTYA